MKEIMNKLLLYVVTFGLIYVLDAFYFRPSLEKKDSKPVVKIENKQPSIDYIPKLVSEQYNG
jgi:hypothetical protein